MRAVTWHGKRDVRVDEVPDPRIENPTDAIVRITSSGICGSDLHLYEVLSPVMRAGDILGHEPMGVVEEVGADVPNLAPGDRVVIPFQISCGSCWACKAGLQTQCDVTQVRDHDMGAAIFGYSKLYGQVPGGQAEYLRVPHADYGPIKVPHGPPDDTFVYLSDVLPTAWQAVQYAAVPPGGSLVVLGLGPIGDMAARIARQLGVARVVGVDRVLERLQRAAARGIDTIDLRTSDDIVQEIRDRFDGRGPDAVIDAVGMEAHGSPGMKTVQAMAGMTPDTVGEFLLKNAGVDRLAALNLAIDVVRRGGTISIIGVYGGMLDPLPMMKMFDKQLQLRMGQANVKRWVDDVMPLVTDDADPLGLGEFATNRVPLAEAPEAYAAFQSKSDGVVKVLLQP